MPLSRRRFLRSGATAVLTTAAALQVVPMAFARNGAKPDPARDFELPSEAGQRSLSDFKRETFEPYLGGMFRVSAGTHSQDMKLTKVRGHELSARGRKLTTKRVRQSDSFVLVFSAARPLTNLTTIYDIEHRGVGNFPLFLTRRNNPAGGYFYEAVFNHAR
jgi:hypothetical protein